MYMRRAPTRIVNVADGTTPAIKAPVTYRYKWQRHAGKQCAGNLELYPRGSNLPIGMCFKVVQFVSYIVCDPAVVVGNY